MTPLEYQRLASRTECDQLKAAKRRIAADHMQEFRYNPQQEREEGLPKTNYLKATRLSHCVLGLTGEVGELAGALERCFHYGKDFDEVNFIEELGDCLWYIALGCNALGVSMEEVMKTNIAKLMARYPQNYSDQLAAEEGRNREHERLVMEAWRNMDLSAGSIIKAASPDSGSQATEEQIKPKFKLCSNCSSPLVKHTPVNCPDCGEPTNAQASSPNV